MKWHVESKVNFFTSNLNKEDRKNNKDNEIGFQLAKFLGVKRKELPIVVGIKTNSKDKAKPPTPFKYLGKLSDTKMLA